MTNANSIAAAAIPARTAISMFGVKRLVSFDVGVLYWMTQPTSGKPSGPWPGMLGDYTVVAEKWTARAKTAGQRHLSENALFVH